MQAEDAEDLRRIVRKLVSAGPAGFASHAARAKAVQTVVHNEVASLLAEPLNTAIEETPHVSISDKRRLAMWVNRELRSLGLAIKAPSGHPGILVADAVRSSDEDGRLRVEARDERGRRLRSSSFWRAPILELMADEAPVNSPRRGR